MKYQKKRWKPYGLEIGETAQRRDADLLPAIVIMHDAAVDFWEDQSNPIRMNIAYFEALKQSGLDDLAKTVSRIQRERTERVSIDIPPIWKATRLNEP